MFVFIIVHLSEEYLWALFQLISTGMGRFLNIFHLNFISLRNIQILCLHCKYPDAFWSSALRLPKTHVSRFHQLPNFLPKETFFVGWGLDSGPVASAVQSRAVAETLSREGLLTRWFNEENVIRVCNTLTDSPCWYWQSSTHKITQSVCCYLVYSRKLDSWAASHRISNCWLFLAGPWMRF